MRPDEGDFIVSGNPEEYKPKEITEEDKKEEIDEKDKESDEDDLIMMEEDEEELRLGRKRKLDDAQPGSAPKRHHQYAGTNSDPILL